jgi:hypothetical protein
MSLSATISVHALDAMGSPLSRCARRAAGQADVLGASGTLQLDGRQIRPVGVGELLARSRSSSAPGRRGLVRSGSQDAGCRSCPAGSG